MTKLGGLVASWVCGVALVGVWLGCTPRADIGVGNDDGSGGEGLSSPQAGSGGSPIDGEGGAPHGGSSGSAGSSAAAGSELAGGNSGSTSSGGASGASGTGGDSGSAGTGGTSGTETGGTSGTGGSGSWGDGELLCGALGNLDASSGVLLDLGLQGGIAWMERTDDRLLATDSDGNWALWDLNGKKVLARGRDADRVWIACPGCPRPDLAGDLFTLVSSTWLEVRSLLDGSLITTIATPAEELPGDTLQTHQNQGGLSPDGSYYWSGTADGIKAWDESGTLLLTKDGDCRKTFSGCKVSAGTDELRIAQGPAGEGVIERISIDTGASTTSPFAGSFYGWFLDGERFFTTQANALRIYATDTATQEALVEYAGETGGQGDYFWSTVSGELWIYAVANPSSPVAKYPVSGQDEYNPYGTYFPVGNRIGLIHETDATVVELGPTGIMDRTVDLPAGPDPWRYTVDAAGNYAFANQRGVVYDGADLEHALSCGQLYDLEGSEQGTLALATSLGLMLFELAPDSRRYVARVPFPSAAVSLSSDGSVLATLSLHGARLFPREQLGDTALSIWSLPDRTQILTRPSPPGAYGLSLSPLGYRFSYAWNVPSDGAYKRQIEDLTGDVNMRFDGDSFISGIKLSPDETRVAVRRGRPPTSHYSTQLYENGTLIGAFDGAPVLWLDQDHLIVHTLSDQNNPDFQRGARIYAIPGGFQPGPQLDLFTEDDADDAAMLSPTEIYSGHLNRVYSLSTGELLWSGPPAGRGAVASNHIVYTVGPQLMFSEY